jgi:NAD(P)-dependent dehydrogenase (short-subunit alcohol dehydrogenase family)
MQFHQRAIEEQVIVVAGAARGVGLATAQVAARRGARVMLTGSSDGDLARVAAALRADGGRVDHRAARVANEDTFRRVADDTVRRFGRIDAWVNDAGAWVYGNAVEVPVDELRRLFEVNFWSVVCGARVAVAHMRATGGTVINVGSLLPDVPTPAQSAYVASKQALKAFTDALRAELADERAPVRVALVAPAHARTTDAVARIIVDCCERLNGDTALAVARSRVYAALDAGPAPRVNTVA